MPPADEKLRHVRPDDAPTDASAKRIGDGDAALAFLQAEARGGERDEVDEARLRRQIDWRIMPVMWACYTLQYLDKTLSE